MEKTRAKEERPLIHCLRQEKLKGRLKKSDKRLQKAE